MIDLKNNKKAKAIFAGCLVAILVVIAIIPIFITSRMNSRPLASAILVEADASVVFSADKDGKVTAVSAQNPKADTILSDNSRIKLLVGMRIDLAVGFYISYLSRAGYIDYSKESAVKISTCEGKNGAIYLSLKETLEYYFKQQGVYVAVISNKISANDFSDLVGIEKSKNARFVVEKLKSKTTLIAESKNNLKSIYDEIVILDSVQETIKSKVDEVLVEVNEKIQMIEEIKTLNTELLNHGECPTIESEKANYFEIKENKIEIQNEEIEEIISDIDELVSKYKKNYSQEILNEEDLGLKLNTLTELKNSLSNVDIEFIENNQEAVLDVLKTYGVNTKKLLNLYESPKNIQEYKEKLNQYFNLKIEKNKSIYDVSREVISDEKYNEFINKIIAENGSLDEFWNKLK